MLQVGREGLSGRVSESDRPPLTKASEEVMWLVVQVPCLVSRNAKDWKPKKTCTTQKAVARERENPILIFAQAWFSARRASFLVGA